MHYIGTEELPCQAKHLTRCQRTILGLRSLFHAGKAPGKVPVHYFGTQEFAWMKTADVVDFGEGLQKGLHLCKRPKAAFLRALHEVSVYFLVS